MAIELSVVLGNRPGTLARLGAVLGDAGVNIEAIMVSTRGEQGFARFVPRDAEAAARALE
jgi:hypothetical protein